MSPSPLRGLAVVPLAALVLHEAVEPRRAAAVREGIRRSGVLTDPIVAAPAPDGRWLVLDGAHRTTALADLGVRAAVVQPMSVVGMPQLDGAIRTDTDTDIDDDPDAEPAGEPGVHPGARLDAWAHDIAGVSAAVLLGGPGEQLVDVGGPGGADRTVVATVEVDGRRVALGSSADLPARLAAMWALAARYADRRYTRCHPTDPGPPAGTARVSWAPARPSDLLGLAELGATFPAGVSRFVVRGRLLGIRVPLADLEEVARRGAIEDAAAARLLGRLVQLPVRLYREPVWVVESAPTARVVPDGHAPR